MAVWPCSLASLNFAVLSLPANLHRLHLRMLRRWPRPDLWSETFPLPHAFHPFLPACPLQHGHRRHLLCLLPPALCPCSWLSDAAILEIAARRLEASYLSATRRKMRSWLNMTAGMEEMIRTLRGRGAPAGLGWCPLAVPFKSFTGTSERVPKSFRQARLAGVREVRS